MNIDQAIKSRKTQKFLAQEPLQLPSQSLQIKQTINELLDLASFAPYHKKCHSDYRSKEDLSSSLPWRTYILDSSNCRALSKKFEDEEINAGKITNMLFAADALLLVTWLPNPSTKEIEEETLFEGNLQNMEHIAAGSAAIQNILIGATGRNIPNYWSSGGILRTEEMKSFLGIPLDEILLGAIFLFPTEIDSDRITIKEGALRNQGKEQVSWTKWIDIKQMNNK